MKLDTTPRRWLVLLSSYLIALVLSVLPVSAWLEPARPDWVGLVVIYWCLALPQYVGIGTAWTLGLILDVLYGSVLGEQACAKALLAFFALRFHLQIRMFPRWQQAVVVFVMIGFSHLVIFWIKSAIGYRFEHFTAWIPSVVTMLFWPIVFPLLRYVRRRARLS